MQSLNQKTLNYDEVIDLVAHLTLRILDVEFKVLVEQDKVYREYDGFYSDINGRYRKHFNARTYIQLEYKAPCTKTGLYQNWKSDKLYLSSYMTEDEVVKKVFVLFERAVKHEVMEGFKFDGKIVFNPHTSFRDLLLVSDKETTRS